MHTNLILPFKPALYSSTLVIKCFKSIVLSRNSYCMRLRSSFLTVSRHLCIKIYSRIKTSRIKNLCDCSLKYAILNFEENKLKNIIKEEYFIISVRSER